MNPKGIQADLRKSQKEQNNGKAPYDPPDVKARDNSADSCVRAHGLVQIQGQ